MRFRLLGNTGLRVSEMFLGGTTFFDRGGAQTSPELRRILETYGEAGGNVIDTAPIYGDSEEVLGELVANHRDRFVLATKYTASWDSTNPNAAGNHRGSLMSSLERSLRRLNTDYVDLLWVHLWDPHTPVEETMRALDDVVRAGKVRYVGISDAPAWVVSRANTLAEWRDWTPFAGIQVPYNLLQRDVERELLPMAEHLGLTVAAWRPLARGALSARSDAADRSGEAVRQTAVRTELRAIAQELECSMAQVALAWIRARSAAICPILGVSSAEQLTENLGALDITLPNAAVQRLTAATDFELGFPSDFLAECAADPAVFGPAATRLDPRA